MKTRLAIFNLELNLDSSVLAAAHDWVESFSEIFENVSVFSTHIGRYLLPPNVNVREIGGGSFISRLIAIFRLIMLSNFFWKQRKQIVVLHHMSTYSVVIIGPLLRLIGVKQGLWYSHSAKSISLKIASKIVNVIFSSSKEALPITSKKARYIGHGISIEKFSNSFLYSKERSGIVSVGRYARIKNYEEFLDLAKFYPKMRFTIYGPSENGAYKEDLVRAFLGKNPNIFLKGAVRYTDLPSILNTYDYFFSGTPKSVDKAAVEAAMCGCFIISESQTTIDVTGMREVWNFLGVECPNSAAEQLAKLEIFQTNRNKMRAILIQSSQKRNSLENLTLKIKSEMVNSSKIKL